MVTQPCFIHRCRGAGGGGGREGGGGGVLKYLLPNDSRIFIIHDLGIEMSKTSIQHAITC